MNIEAIENRIEELEYDKADVVKRARNLKKEEERISGAIAEMWKWHEEEKTAGGYGRMTFDGSTRVLKLPEFEDEDEMYKMLRGELEASDGENEAEAREARTERARVDGQIAIDRMNQNAEGIQ